MASPVCTWVCLAADTVRKAVNRSQQTKLDCKPPPSVEQSPFLFGIDWVWRVSKARVGRYFLVDYCGIHERLNRTFTVDVFGATAIHTCDPENFKHVFSAQFPKFEMGPVRHAALGPLMGDGIFTSDGDAWNHARRTIKPSMTRQLSSAAPLFESNMQEMLSQLPRDGSPVDLQPLLFKLTIDTTAEFLFGFSKMNPQLLAELDSAMVGAQAGIGLRSFAGPLLMDLVSSRHFFDSCRRIHQIVEDHVAAVLAGLSGRTEEKEDTTVLGALGRRYDSRPRIGDQVINLLVAGRDTTAGLISLTLSN